MTFRPRGLSFRTRITLTNTAIVLAAGVALVVTLNIIMRSLLVWIASTSDLDLDDAQVRYEYIDGVLTPVVVSGDPGQGYAMVTQEQLSQLIVWSVVLLAGFGIAAWAVSRWSVGRALRRVAQVTETTRRITGADLSERLSLRGPRDEIKELGDTIDAMLSRLSASFQAQSRFAANASHELRTPLTVSQASLEAPLVQGLIGPDASPDIERALEALRHSDRLITALLELARSESTLTAAQTVDMGALLRDELDGAGREAQAADLTVRDESTKDRAFVRGDRTLLTQVVRNLLDNAIRHNVPGGWVSATLNTVPGGLELVVRNSGPVLDPDQVQHLTEPFHRGQATRLADSSGRDRGYGLGLALVSNIVTAHAGTLLLEPRTDGGLDVTVLLPADGQQDEQAG